MYQQQKANIDNPRQVNLNAPIGLSRCIAYPGWRCRMGDDGVIYHEKIPNPILRFVDWTYRSIVKSKYEFHPKVRFNKR